MSIKLQSTKGQAKHGAANKLRRPRSTFRNFMAQPFPRYWPQLNDDNANQLMHILQSAKKTNPTLFETKKSENRKSLYFGLSNCVQRLKTGSVCALLISADLKPRYVINQIILLALARNKSISVLCVPSLDYRLSKILPFSCFSFAITSAGTRDLQPVLDWCKSTISTYHPPPPQILQHFARFTQTPKRFLEDQKEAMGITKDVEMFEGSVERFYLKKCDSDQRAFVPKNVPDARTVSDDKKDDFISLDNTRSINGITGNSSVEAEVRSKLNDIQLIAGNAQGKNSKRIWIPHRNKHGKQFFKIPHEKTKKGKLVGDNPRLTWGDNFHKLQVNKIQGNHNRTKKTK